MAKLKRAAQAAWMVADLRRWQTLSTHRTAMDLFKGCPKLTEEEFAEFEKTLGRSQWSTAYREVELGDFEPDDPTPDDTEEHS